MLATLIRYRPQLENTWDFALIPFLLVKYDLNGLQSVHFPSDVKQDNL